MAQFRELEHAVCDVIQNVKEIQDLRQARLLVIGGLALWHYLPEYRSTDNINFVTNISTSPSSLKKRLLERPGSPFFQRSQALFYKGPRGREIRVDISPEWLSPYLPKNAMRVQEISQDQIPYVSLIDLIVFKLDSSGLRSNPIKKERDARDAAALVEFASRKGSIELSEKQEQVVEEALCDVAKCGTKEKGWWESRMGLDKKPVAATPDERQGRGKQSRPHSKSDPSPSGSPIAYDSNAAWHYEQLDCANTRQFNPLRSNRGNGRSGLARSTSHRLLRDKGFIMTQPKTTHHNVAKRSGLSKEITADLDHRDDYDDQYYTIEPHGNSSPQGRQQGGYFDLPIPCTSTEEPGIVTEHKAVHTPVGVMRTPGPEATLSNVTRPRRPPFKEKRSISFLL
ncbi:hypothetical protein GGR54DRAFT_637639 [Hypoxylon sp. NC1633]|nr:hypothetical protein GGR54DRAFT_637639 [Hypoxylon sp. NC1633]